MSAQSLTGCSVNRSPADTDSVQQPTEDGSHASPEHHHKSLTCESAVFAINMSTTSSRPYKHISTLRQALIHYEGTFC